jgi:putative transposase
MADVTEIPSRFRLFDFHLAVVLDVFSRMPLAWEIFYFKPTARQMARLFRSAVRRFGKPRYFVSDHGTEFTGKPFRRYLGAIGVKHRFGAVGRTGSIAIIERIWRTLKDGLRARYSAPPLILAQLEHRVRLELLYYAYFRPHQALDGATPSEVYFGKKPRHLDATDAPRARAGGGPASLPVRLAFLDKERRFPILLRRAA